MYERVMKIDKIDFGQNKECKHCGRILTAKAYFVLENGEEIYFGPECVKKYFSHNISDIPDFTRAGNNYKSNSKIRTQNMEKNSNSEIINEKIIIEYIRLRCELLTEFQGIEDTNILDIYMKYKKLTLDEDDKKYLNALINYFEKINSKFGYRNLMACYMAKIVLILWMQSEENNFAKGIHNFLLRNYYLTEKQIIGANNWIKNMEGMKNINGKWFYKN